ncbi:MAG TPA: hypothetical protein VNF06_03270 [Candidatus Aquilonibacter sp.]|nr:hypothetical protein [Candidatus Aquilonibacter sp.]
MSGGTRHAKLPRTRRGIDICAIEVCSNDSLVISKVSRGANLSHPMTIECINRLGACELIQTTPYSYKPELSFQATPKGIEAAQKYHTLLKLLGEIVASGDEYRVNFQKYLNTLALCKEPSSSMRIYLNSPQTNSDVVISLRDLLKIGAIKRLSDAEIRGIRRGNVALNGEFYLCTEKGFEILKNGEELEDLFKPSYSFDYSTELSNITIRTNS